MIDINVHLLPGIDNLELDANQSILMLEKSKIEGVTHWIVTPNYNNKRSLYTYDALKLKYDQWFQTFGNNATNGNLIFGMQVLIDDDLLSNLDEMMRIPTFENSHYMLVEFDLSWSYERIREAIIKLKAHGVIPILAHIETYIALNQSANKVKGLSDEGALIQLTASSILDKKHQKFIKDLFMSNAIDLVASDGHNLTTQPPLLKESYDFVSKYYSKAWANRLFQETPMKIFSGAPYFRPQNSLRSQKSYRASIGLSIVFGLMLIAVGLSQMMNGSQVLSVETIVEITEELVPAGIDSNLSYDAVIDQYTNQFLELYHKYDAAFGIKHAQIISAQNEISNLKVQSAQIDSYLIELTELEAQLDRAFDECLSDFEDELLKNGYPTTVIETFKSDYIRFKTTTKNKY